MNETRGGVKLKGGVLGWRDGTLSQGRCEGESKNADSPASLGGGVSPGALLLRSAPGADGPTVTAQTHLGAPSSLGCG